MPVRVFRFCLAWLLLATLLPTALYEAVQKTAEAIGPRGTLLWLSCEAEDRTQWRPRSGFSLLDHAHHELAETRLFWQLTAHLALGSAFVDSRQMVSSSALPVEIVDR